jgi:large subunit ribosomal protein L35Ae
MEGIIKNYRRGRNTQHHFQYVVEVEGIDSREKAVKLAGKKVAWKSVASKTIAGKILDTHGNSGAVRVRFEKGLPGQAIGDPVTVSA